VSSDHRIRRGESLSELGLALFLVVLPQGEHAIEEPVAVILG
jgi:hypothetical protein